MSGFLVELSSNGDMEAVDPVNPNYAEDWSVRAANFHPPNNYTYRRTDAYSASGDYSVMLKASDVDSENEFWYLVQEIDATEIPVGVKLEMSVKVRTAGLQGSGFEVALSGRNEYEQGTGLYRSSFDMTRQVSGNTDWEEYTLTVESFPESIQQLEIYLIISPNTVGEVYFDDLRLVYYI
jgi:hypothetical protein